MTVCRNLGKGARWGAYDLSVPSSKAQGGEAVSWLTGQLRWERRLADLRRAHATETVGGDANAAKLLEEPVEQPLAS